MPETPPVRPSNNEGLFADPSVPAQESIPAADEDSILDSDSEGEITSAQKQRSPDPAKRHQEERPQKPSPRKRTQKNARDHDEHLPRKKPRQNHPESAKEIKKRIRKSEESTHSEKGTCPKTLRYSARASISPDEEFKKEISFIRKNAFHRPSYLKLIRESRNSENHYTMASILMQ